MLRAQGRTQSPLQALQQQQIPQSTTPQKILPQQQQSPVQSNRSSPQPNISPHHITAQQQNAQGQKVQIPQQQIRIPQKIVLTPAQHQLLQRQQQLSNQRILLTGNTSAGQLVSTSRGLVMIQAQPGTSRLITTAAGVKTQLAVAPASAADKAKHKSFTGISR